MNGMGRLFGFKGEARIKLMHGEFQVLSAGDFVRCAVTGQPIPLSELRYWNVDRQEPYASAEIAMKRYIELGGNAQS